MSEVTARRGAADRANYERGNPHAPPFHLPGAAACGCAGAPARKRTDAILVYTRSDHKER